MPLYTSWWLVSVQIQEPEYLSSDRGSMADWNIVLKVQSHEGSIEYFQCVMHCMTIELSVDEPKLFSYLCTG